MHILLVEDDALLGSAVDRALRTAAHAVDWVRDLRAARAALADGAFGAVLVDLGLPDGDGRAVIETVGAMAERPLLIVISARDQIGDRVGALDLGADDYLVKPFDLDELLARLRAVQRRLTQPAARVIRVGDIELDPLGVQVRRDGRELELSQREFQVLEALLTRRGQVVSREQLREAIYTLDRDIGSNTVEVFVHLLRRKLGPRLIRTVRGRGYVIDA